VIGNVDSDGRALVRLQVRRDADSPPMDVTAWVDTAFTGELVMPRATVRRLALLKSATVPAILADGTQVTLESYSCVLEWFGKRTKVEVVENDGQFPLLGIGLLRSRRLEVNYRASSVTLD
jgi:clan AA aspartic protease